MFPSTSGARSWPHRVFVASGCAALSLLAASCTFGPRDPATVGVIASSDRRDGVTALAFVDGSTLELNLSESEMLDGSSGLEPGTLWLSGAAGDWYVTLYATTIAPLGSQEPRDCFFVGSFGTRDDGHILFDNGLRLPLASDFDPGSVTDDRFDNPGGGFCADEAGRLLFYDA